MGEIADWMIEQEIWGYERDNDFGDTYYEPRTPTEVAEEVLEDAKKNKKVKDLNKGVIEW